MNNLSNVQIEVGGKRVEVFSRVRINQWIDQHHTFELSVPIEQFEGKGAKKINQSKDFIGKEIFISIKYQIGSGNPFNFRGFITQLYLYKQASLSREITIRGFSASILLEQGSRYAAFYKVDHGTIVNKILSEYDMALLRPSVSPRQSQTEDYIVKFDESSYNFLHRFAATTGNWFFYDGEKTVFGDVTGANPIDLRYGDDISSFDMRMDMPDGEFYIKDYNYRQGGMSEKHSKDVKVSGLGEYGQFLLDKAEQLYPERKFGYSPLPVWADSELKQQVSHAKKASVANAVIYSGSSNVIGLKVGTVIDVKERSTSSDGKTESYGQYRIISITHDADIVGGYSNRFEAIPAGVEFRANPSFTIPRATTQMAKVTHVDDPDHLGRIRVQFLWQEAQGDTESSTWIRVLTPYTAHPNQGHYFIPEKNSLVMVIFENDDPARPLVAGVMPHREVKMDTYYSADNYYKAIITQGGNHIVISDEPGKECISLHDKDRKNHIMMSLDGGAHINIKSQGTINLDAGTINLSAKNINVKAKEKLYQEAEDIALDAKSNININ